MREKIPTISLLLFGIFLVWFGQSRPPMTEADWIICGIGVLAILVAASSAHPTDTI